MLKMVIGCVMMFSTISEPYIVLAQDAISKAKMFFLKWHVKIAVLYCVELVSIDMNICETAYRFLQCFSIGLVALFANKAYLVITAIGPVT